ncbi:MAG TPA: glycosyl transferase group 1 [Verrucomicrobiales bacterium]|nr:glycosyl transferase group 1 [Verrucomicrobiales bacterium]
MRFLMLNWRDPKNPLAGGAEQVSQRYLQALRERGHEVAWFANRFPGSASFEEIDGIPVHRGGGQGTSIVSAMKWCNAQRRFDLVIDQHHGIPWYAPWWCGTNCVAYIHEVLGPIWNSFFNWPWDVIGRWQERMTHELYSRVPFWTPSDSTRRLLELAGVQTVKVLPNGVDAVPLKELPPKPLTEPVQLITVSRLAPNKRVDHAVQLLAELRKRGVRAELSIVGGGHCEPDLKGLVKSLELVGEVHFRGRVSDVEKNRLLAAAHFLVHPSQREGWGLNVIEANAMGTPALVYPVGGLVDSTIADVTGLVAARETPAALADELGKLSLGGERYAGLRENAWRRAFEFRWERVLTPACEWLEEQARG